MRELTKHATTHELHVLMDMVHESETTTSEQAKLLYAIVDELTDRGEIDEITEDEIHTAMKKTLLKANQPDIVRESMSQTEPEWMDNLRTDMLQDRQRRKARHKSYFRTSIVAASVIFALFLTNTIALATGHDLFGAVSNWTKDAVYFIFGTDSANEPKQGTTKQYDILKETLNKIGIQVDLPSAIPDHFVFDSLEPDEPDESDSITAWFSDGSNYFSIYINRISKTGQERFNESDGEEYTDIYPKTNGMYMVSTNKSRIKAIWYQGIYEIRIQGNITYEQLIRILDSI